MVQGCRGLRMISRTGPLSTMRPAYITGMRSATSTATPLSCVTKIVAAVHREVHAAHGLHGLRPTGEGDARVTHLDHMLGGVLHAPV